MIWGVGRREGGANHKPEEGRQKGNQVRVGGQSAVLGSRSPIAVRQSRVLIAILKMI